MAQLHLTYRSRKQLEHIPKYTETKTMKYEYSYNYSMIYTPRLVGDVEFRSNTFEFNLNRSVMTWSAAVTRGDILLVTFLQWRVTYMLYM